MKAQLSSEQLRATDREFLEYSFFKLDVTDILDLG
jgi:hypothetical protein